jgi:alanine dehydrogenase
MIIGVPTEILNHEYRVGMTPAGVHVMVKAGHKVFIQRGAGLGSGLQDAEYTAAGATILPTAAEVYGKAEMIVKVKEPKPAEWPMIRDGQVLFTYFHFAAAKELTQAMIKSGAICIAYETVQTEGGVLPLLVPMSEVAGRMAVQEGAKYLERPMMGRGILLGGVPGVERGYVVILGGGIVGINAARVAAGLGALVNIFDNNLDRLRFLDVVMPPNVSTTFSTPLNIQAALREADLLIGAVLIAGARAPRLVPREYLKLMKPGAVVVDVSVDQGGCVETIKPTTHAEPTYIVDDVVHYAVANMPGAVGRTSTFALTNATLRYAEKLAGLGAARAVREDAALARGANVVRGAVTCKGVADAFGMKLEDPVKAMSGAPAAKGKKGKKRE